MPPCLSTLQAGGCLTTFWFILCYDEIGAKFGLIVRWFYFFQPLNIHCELYVLQMSVQLHSCYTITCKFVIKSVDIHFVRYLFGWIIRQTFFQTSRLFSLFHFRRPLAHVFCLNSRTVCATDILLWSSGIQLIPSKITNKFWILIRVASDSIFGE